METATLGAMVSHRMLIIGAGLLAFASVGSAAAQSMAATQSAEISPPTSPALSSAAAPAASSSPSYGSISQQFSEGAQHVGKGASQIGQGIANGAVTTWDAIKAGANAFANKVSGGSSGG